MITIFHCNVLVMFWRSRIFIISVGQTDVTSRRALKSNNLSFILSELATDTDDLTLIPVPSNIVFDTNLIKSI